MYTLGTVVQVKTWHRVRVMGRSLACHRKRLIINGYDQQIFPCNRPPTTTPYKLLLISSCLCAGSKALSQPEAFICLLFLGWAYIYLIHPTQPACMVHLFQGIRTTSRRSLDLIYISLRVLFMSIVHRDTVYCFNVNINRNIYFQTFNDNQNLILFSQMIYVPVLLFFQADISIKPKTSWTSL